MKSSPSTKRFDELYKSLNKAQKQAVDAIEGPVMVVAGPGTGKTQILTLRIANILRQTDTSPDSILALTFTESAAQTMRRRLVDIIGNAGYRVNFYTFHGFCNDIIKTYPEDFPRIISSNAITDVEQIRIMEKIIESNSLKYLKPFGDQFYYLRPALSAIKNLKRENVSVKEFEKSIKAQEKNFEHIPDKTHTKGAHVGKMKGEYADLEKKINKNKELVGLYKKYQETLDTEKLYDFEDMLIEVIEALEKNKDLLLRFQEKYQYVLADEHQDANNAQNRILELLSNFHDSPNLFIVGDEKQAIFRFQGASLENFLYFKKLYPQAVVINLEQNYRSTQTILDGAHSLIVNNKIVDEKLRVKLSAHQTLKNIPKLCVYEFSDPDSEIYGIVTDIEKRIQNGVKPHEIAVIYRDNKDAGPLIRSLEKTTVPFSVQSDQDVLRDEDIQNLILLVRAIHDFGNDELLGKLLYVQFLGIQNLDSYKLVSYAAKKRINLFDVVSSESEIKNAGVSEPQKITDVYKKLSHWNTISLNKNILDSFEIIAHESGFLAHCISQPHALDKIAKVNNVFSEVKKIAENKRDAKLGDFISFIDMLRKYNILLKTGSVGAEMSSVRLLTAHKSKGLEFEYVYIVGAYDGHWGNKRDIKHFHVPVSGLGVSGHDPLDDERRLFYVALTRAKKQVIMSYATAGADGRMQLPAQFVSEIDAKLIDKKICDTHKQSSIAPKVNPGIDIQDKKFLQQLFLEQGLSVTALNKYLSCPWDYFFNNLLRIPASETKHQMYGTAIHATLREYFTAYAREDDLSKAEVLALFEGHLHKMPFYKQDYIDSLEKGKKALAGYIESYKKTWPRNLVTEYRIKNVFIRNDTLKHDIMLRGVIDKIEFLSDTQVNVVDYKTAKPESRNAIMGATKNANGDYFRQLVFYKLLLDNAEDKKYIMKSGEIDFVEPDDKGRYRKERFEIGDEDVQKLEHQIKDISTEIYNFSFWDKKCGDKDCEFCSLRNLIQP